MLWEISCDVIWKCISPFGFSLSALLIFVVVVVPVSFLQNQYFTDMRGVDVSVGVCFYLMYVVEIF